MNKYQPWVWITPARPVKFPVIEAKSFDEAWNKLKIPRYSLIERFKDQSAVAQYAGNNGRIYRRKVKLTRLQ